GSTLMTSAPNAASRWVAAGPAQKAVRSTIRTPSSGRPGAVGSRSDLLVCQGDSSLSAPGALVSRTGAGAHADISHGGRGCVNPAGLGTNALRSRTYSESRIVEPLPN